MMQPGYQLAAWTMTTIEYNPSTGRENKEEGLHFYTRIGTKLLETCTCLN